MPLEVLTRGQAKEQTTQEKEKERKIPPKEMWMGS